MIYLALLAQQREIIQELSEDDDHLSAEARQELQDKYAALNQAIDIRWESMQALIAPNTILAFDPSEEPITVGITDSIKHAYTQYLEKQAEVDDLKKEREMLMGLVAPEVLPARLQEIDARIAVAEAEAEAVNKKRGLQREEDEF